MNAEQLNWENIEKNFPKSFKKLTTVWATIHIVDSHPNEAEVLIKRYINERESEAHVWELFHTRDLYSFFDDFNIKVFITEIWDWSITARFTDVVVDRCSYSESFENRKQTEVSAFMKAFELLEQFR